jgi:uncharacterized protein YegL
MGAAPVEAINDSLPALHQEIGSNPALADKTRFCLIGFSSRAEVLLPLADLSTVSSIPGLHANGVTSYGPVFELLYATITDDAARLRAEGVQVYRPAVFFVSDGQPSDSWEAAYKRLTDTRWRLHPNILAFGVGNTDPRTMQEVATVRAFVADGTMGPGLALREFAQSLIRSIVVSASSAGSET